MMIMSEKEDNEYGFRFHEVGEMDYCKVVGYSYKV